MHEKWQQEVEEEESKRSESERERSFNVPRLWSLSGRGWPPLPKVEDEEMATKRRAVAQNVLWVSESLAWFSDLLSVQFIVFYDLIPRASGSAGDRLDHVHHHQNEFISLAPSHSLGQKSFRSHPISFFLKIVRASEDLILVILLRLINLPTQSGRQSVTQSVGCDLKKNQRESPVIIIIRWNVGAEGSIQCIIFIYATISS